MQFGTATSIAIDSSGKEYMTLVDNTNAGTPKGLAICNNTAGGWSCNNVHGTVSIITANIAVDSGKVYVVAYDYTNTKLIMVNNSGGGYVATTIVATTKSGQYPSIVFDINHNAHISYYDGTSPGTFVYGNNTNGGYTWVTLGTHGSLGNSGNAIYDMGSNPQMAIRKGWLGNSTTQSPNITIGWYNMTGGDFYVANLVNYLLSPPATIDLYLNGTAGNRSYMIDTYANFTAISDTPTASITLTSDFPVFYDDTANGRVENITHLITLGTNYFIKAALSGGSSLTYYFNVTMPPPSQEGVAVPADYGILISFINPKHLTIMVR
jgi:hypothetical protein